MSAKKKKSLKKSTSKKIVRSAFVKKTIAIKNSFPIQPLGDKVLVKITAEEKISPSGIIIPETAKQEKSDRGTVVAAGPGRMDENGKRLPMDVKVGDTVLFQWGDKIEYGGEEYYLVSETNISAVIK